MSRLVAVTGANGFIGQNVVRHFREAGWAVRAIVRPGRRDGVPTGVETIDTNFVATERGDFSPRLPSHEAVLVGERARRGA